MARVPPAREPAAVAAKARLARGFAAGAPRGRAVRRRLLESRRGRRAPGEVPKEAPELRPRVSEAARTPPGARDEGHLSERPRLWRRDHLGHRRRSRRGRASPSSGVQGAAPPVFAASGRLRESYGHSKEHRPQLGRALLPSGEADGLRGLCKADVLFVDVRGPPGGPGVRGPGVGVTVVVGVVARGGKKKKEEDGPPQRPGVDRGGRQGHGPDDSRHQGTARNRKDLRGGPSHRGAAGLWQKKSP
mmetsp:Transcript_21129/g.68128  ORF Transcript_21129/g.68128 Transcript_21129/m.68128 type:complete len:246 (+) Transcript_21129:1737-2474(+)